MMKRTTFRKRMGLTALFLTLALCGGLLAGCSSSDTEESENISSSVEESEAVDTSTAEPETGTDETQESESLEDGTGETASDDVVGVVSAIAEDGTVTLSLYQLTEAGAGYTITDYADVALDNYEDSGVTQDYDLSTVATIQSAADGALTDALLGDIAVGDVLILYTTADGGAGVASILPRADKIKLGKWRKLWYNPMREPGPPVPDWDGRTFSGGVYHEADCPHSF